jgi:hypothetical protein
MFVSPLLSSPPPDALSDELPSPLLLPEVVPPEPPDEDEPEPEDPELPDPLEFPVPELPLLFPFVGVVGVVLDPEELPPLVVVLGVALPEADVLELLLPEPFPPSPDGVLAAAPAAPPTILEAPLLAISAIAVSEFNIPITLNVCPCVTVTAVDNPTTSAQGDVV